MNRLPASETGAHLQCCIGDLCTMFSDAPLAIPMTGSTMNLRQGNAPLHTALNGSAMSRRECL